MAEDKNVGNTSRKLQPGVVDLLPELNITPERVRQHVGPVGAAGSSLALQLQNDGEFRKIYNKEAKAREYYAKGLESLEAAERHMRELPLATLPMTIKRLKEQIQSNERACHNYAKMVRSLAQDLKAPCPVDESEDPSLLRLRTNLGDLLDDEAKRLADKALDLNQERKKKEGERLRQLLPYAFPNATEEELEAALEQPEVAEICLDRGAHKAGSEKLSVVVAQVQSSRECLDKIVEDESVAIEMLFGQFDQIVATQEQHLGEVEENVLHTLEETEEALDNLKEARSLKVGNLKRKCCCILIVVILVLYLFWWFFGAAIMERLNIEPEEVLPPPLQPPENDKVEPIIGELVSDSSGGSSTTRAPGNNSEKQGAETGAETSLLAMYQTIHIADSARLERRRSVRKARRFMA